MTIFVICVGSSLLSKATDVTLLKTFYIFGKKKVPLELKLKIHLPMLSITVCRF